jgi:hypothetical protein
LIPGSKGHNLLLQKQNEACVNGGKASHATNDGMWLGQHVMDKGKISMATEDRCKKATTVNNATGSYRNQHQAYATQKIRGNGIPGMSAKQRTARNLV